MPPYKKTTLLRVGSTQSIFRSFSPVERVLFWIFLTIFVISTGVLLLRANAYFLTEIPVRGGSFTEGVIGSPRFINPLLSTSDSDRDLTALVYSGLMRTSADGTLFPDLADSYEISDDGTTYTFTLKEGIVFHDGEPITTDDIIYTVTMAQNPLLKSPRRASWEGVSIEKIDERTVRFTLPQPYAPFLENTTLGILPKHLWESVSAEQYPFSQLNIEPVGSGPFAVKDIKRDSGGLPAAYTLTAFADFALGIPNLHSITLRFYSSEEELILSYQKGEIHALHSISPEHTWELSLEGARVETSVLPRIFGVFFNQNQSELFTDEIVRRALALSAPKELIIDEVLRGYAVSIDSPVPPGIFTTFEIPHGIETFTERMNRAQALLEENGWKKDKETGVLVHETEDETKRLSFSLSTSNAPELKAVATILAEVWREMGVEVDVQFFDTSDLNQNIIRPRRYDTLLFGEIVGRELDLFSFWHSSQRNDPGLNIALYANITADKLLSDARANTNREEREKLYRQFEEEVETDAPAVFLYAPLFTYIIPENIHALQLGPLTTSSDRFANVHEWYTETEYVWPFFNK